MNVSLPGCSITSQPIVVPHTISSVHLLMKGKMDIDRPTSPTLCSMCCTICLEHCTNTGIKLFSMRVLKVGLSAFRCVFHKWSEKETEKKHTHHFYLHFHQRFHCHSSSRSVPTVSRKDCVLQLHKVVEKRFLQTIGMAKYCIHDVRMRGSQNQLWTEPCLKPTIILPELLQYLIEQINAWLSDEKLRIPYNGIVRLHHRQVGCKPMALYDPHLPQSEGC